ncbi:MAG: hypothetical protein WC497_00225 [Patescibacteria group bacterium]
MSLFQTLEDKAKQKRRRIGISILRWNDPIRASLEKAKAIADIIVYGDPKYGFNGVTNDNQEEVGRQMVRDYKAGKLDQFVRGQVDDFGTVDEFKKQFGVPDDLRRFGPALMRDAFDREFWMILVSNPEGQTLEQKVRYADGVLAWLKEMFPSFVPKVAVMATCRPGSVGRDPVMTQSYEQAESLVSHLSGEGIESKNVHIEIENAITWSNFIIPANGTIGNQIFRALCYLGRGKILVCPTILPGYGIYEDDSRNEEDWYPHIAAAAAYVKK